MGKTILITGGGTAGHVNPNIALIPKLVAEGWTVHYAGTEDGIERELIAKTEGVTYHTISSGKLRRYFSLRNFTDPFRVLKGIFQCKKLIKSIKPDAVFSKGGYVSVPVVIAARKKAPVICHESDYTPGLANKISAHFADVICVSFEDTLSLVGKKGIFTGTPIRGTLYTGSAEKGRVFAGLDDTKPILLVMGGSLGAQAINQALLPALPELLTRFHVIHLCGRGKVDPDMQQEGYVAFEYVTDEMPDVFAAADIVVSRAGANAIFELLALEKPALLIPLPQKSSRGDQVQNTNYFGRKGYSMVLPQSELTSDTLLAAVNKLYDQRSAYIEAMKSAPPRGRHRESARGDPGRGKPEGIENP